MLFGLGVSEFFTTEYAETRFAGHGMQLEKSPFGPGTGNPHHKKESATFIFTK